MRPDLSALPLFLPATETREKKALTSQRTPKIGLFKIWHNPRALSALADPNLAMHKSNKSKSSKLMYRRCSLTQYDYPPTGGSSHSARCLRTYHHSIWFAQIFVPLAEQSSSIGREEVPKMKVKSEVKAGNSARIDPNG